MLITVQTEKVQDKIYIKIKIQVIQNFTSILRTGRRNCKYAYIFYQASRTQIKNNVLYWIEEKASIEPSKGKNVLNSDMQNNIYEIQNMGI